jgi:hypothetical protein
MYFINDMLKIWDTSSQKLALVILLIGRKRVLHELQKVLQEINLLLPDLVTARDIRGKFHISGGCLPGDEKRNRYILTTMTKVMSRYEKEELQRTDEKCSAQHHNVTTGRRLWCTVRAEVVASFIALTLFQGYLLY